jgi:hypothetical protein
MDGVVPEGHVMENAPLIVGRGRDVEGRLRRMVEVPEIGVPTRMKPKVPKESSWRDLMNHETKRLWKNHYPNPNAFQKNNKRKRTRHCRMRNT